MIIDMGNEASIIERQSQQKVCISELIFPSSSLPAVRSQNGILQLFSKSDTLVGR